MGGAMETIRPHHRERIDYNLAIVGGGRACRFFLDLPERESFPYININIVGVCDIDLGAEGITMAHALGIFTTDDFRELFRIPKLNAVIELTF